MLESLQPGRQPDEIYSAHQQEPWIFNLATEPKLLDMLERQVGPNIVMWSSHILCKAPGAGRHVPWHQDAPYWNVGGRLPGGVWIAFDDVDASNGSMCILPGWHNKGVLPRNQNPDKVFPEAIDPSALPADVDQLKSQYNLSAGQMAIHDTMIPHTSHPNTSQRWRRVLVLRYLAADGQMGSKQYEDYRTGQPFAREFFLVRGEDVTHKGLKRSPFEG